MIDLTRLHQVLTQGDGWHETANPTIVDDPELGQLLCFDHKGLEVGTVQVRVPVEKINAYRYRKD